MSCIFRLATYVKNRNYCSQCRTFRHGCTSCPIIRRRASLIVLMRIQLEIVENEETLIHLLYQMPRENLVIIARNYELNTTVNTEVLIRNMANHMATVQISGKLLASTRISRLCEQYPGMELSEIVAVKIQEMYISGRDAGLSTDSIVSNIRQYVFTELYENQSEDIKNKLQVGFIQGTYYLLQVATNAISMEARVQPMPTAPPMPVVTVFLKNIVILKAREPVPVNKEQECCICFDCKPMKDFVKTGCNHEYCYSCIESHLIKDATHRCPICRATVNTLTYCF